MNQNYARSIIDMKASEQQSAVAVQCISVINSFHDVNKVCAAILYVNEASNPSGASGKYIQPNRGHNEIFRTKVTRRWKKDVY